ncbi:hypothetical protein [Actinomadura oligospora]|uniref:hypothetical protein n=1 Tax=Actinomadura oligospora TaxID=111804 RepID=UPI0004AE2133|nr:hypothetical protein [Actinomadura oligospora]
MRFQNNDETPFAKAIAKKKSKNDFKNPRAASLADHGRRNAGRTPTRQFNRGR